MVRVITVEREYGSLGGEFARLLAQHLKWELVDQSLVQEVAQRAGVSAAEATRRDERLDPWYSKVGRAFWHGSNERADITMEREILDTTRMTELAQEVMKEKARAGNCVVVGRGASCALHGVPGCFHIFVYASTLRKVRWFVQAFPDKAHLAERELAATDQRRAEYIEHFYHTAWNDYRIYHLMLNSCMGFDAMIGATIEATGV
ncbi:MAG TPA: cytidylate kinase-like family protein [Acidobacteriaceae bacterium]|nr:cytidylate kinase-like family protein [Terriglobia bacterium]HUX45128.1 cytidylate kinase-like family protein [Terracidiphilus sp.]HVC90847.1 cytidylate kinase-like family protein [Acidobacteriaceae bacterium]